VTYPVLSKGNSSEQPSNIWTYILAEQVVTADQAQFQPIGQATALYLMMNMRNEEFTTPDFPLPDFNSKTSYPWVRAEIDANGNMTCTDQGDPDLTSLGLIQNLGNAPGDGDYPSGASGQCPPNFGNGGPNTVTQQPFTPQPQPVTTPTIPPPRHRSQDRTRYQLTS
jgi:hypothetical protein